MVTPSLRKFRAKEKADGRIEYQKGDVYLRDMKNTKYVQPWLELTSGAIQQRSTAVLSTRQTPVAS